MTLFTSGKAGVKTPSLFFSFSPPVRDWEDSGNPFSTIPPFSELFFLRGFPWRSIGEKEEDSDGSSEESGEENQIEPTDSPRDARKPPNGVPKVIEEESAEKRRKPEREGGKGKEEGDRGPSVSRFGKGDEAITDPDIHADPSDPDDRGDDDRFPTGRGRD